MNKARRPRSWFLWACGWLVGFYSGWLCFAQPGVPLALLVSAILIGAGLIAARKLRIEKYVLE